MKKHDIKCLARYFEPIRTEQKKFEIRKNDRDYQVGDYLNIKEWNPEFGYMGRSVKAKITYMTDYEQKEGYVVLSLDLNHFL